MNGKSIISIFIPDPLKSRVEQVAKSYGASIEEVVEQMLTKFANREIKLSSASEPILLTPDAKKKRKAKHIQPSEFAEQLSSAAAARYEKEINDIEKGKVKTKSFSSVDDLMKYLNS